MNKLEIYRRVDGLWAWRLRAANGQVLATDGGQGYAHQAECREIAVAIVDGVYSSARTLIL